MKKLKAIICVLIGHSKIQSYCMGYFSCGRCRQQLGDSVGSTYCAKNVVIINHNCKTCRRNYKKLTWKDKLFVPDPFKEA